MIYDEYGQIRFKGVTDSEDSPVAAACAVLFENRAEIEYLHYFKGGVYQRCQDSKYTFSRDQFVCLAAVLYEYGREALVSLERVDGKDFMSPSIRGHERICQGLKPYWYQTLWFKADLWFSATFKPRDELNQLFCMLLVHPDQSLLKWYCKMNPLWPLAITDYFDSWRDEKELAELMIKTIQDRISGQ